MAKRFAILAATLMSASAFAQTSTTVTTQQPPPPSSSTTVTTQPAPAPQPGTQVVVNPGTSTTTTTAAPAPATSVETVRSGRSAAAIVATDALYGGVAGALVGGGVALINSGNNWQRDLMVGGGVGVLVGAAVGVFEAVNDHPSNTVVRAAADRNPAESTKGLSAQLYTGRF